MCGIVGVFGPPDPKVLDSMNSALIHRGPDDGHIHCGKDFGFGARRLSIIDLQGGRQPLSGEEGRVWVVQNGEIYNFQELRQLLKGHSFATRSDTEVIAHAYEEWGADCLHRFNGMFAIALWDARAGAGMLARDRAGKKPLYYAWSQDGSLYFASEIKALLRLPFLSREIDPDALHLYLGYKHVPAPLTIFKSIRCLPPAHRMILKRGAAGGLNVRMERYWKVPFVSNGQARHESQVAQELLDRLRIAIRRRLVSDVPIGFYLSGGVDSSLVCALAAQMHSEPIDTFTLVYEPQSATPAKDLDRAFARKVSKMFGTRHHEEEIGIADLTRHLPKILAHFDEPFAGVISTYFLSRLIARHVKVAISGDGADELFGSYLSHRLAWPIHNYLQGRAEFAGFGPEFVKRLADPDPGAWRYKLLVFSDEDKPYSDAWRNGHRLIDAREHLRGYFRGLEDRDPLNRILEAEFYSLLPDQVLTFVDRLSMAHSLEVRCPYLDHEFIAAAAAVPGDMKIHNGEVKWILKLAAEQVLPKDLVRRPKEGFLMPVVSWLAGSLKPWVLDLLSAERLARQNILDAPTVERLLREFYEQGRTELGQKIYTLVAFQVWYDSVYRVMS